MWMVRAGEHGRLIEDFRQHSVVAIGWKELGDLSAVKDADEIRKRIEEAYSDKSQGWKAIAASQVSRFRFDFAENDYVVTYNPESREYLVGVVKSPYQYDPSRKEYCNFRKVDWKGKVSRDKDDSELTGNDVLVRYKGKEIIGLTILHFSERQKKQSPN